MPQKHWPFIVGNLNAQKYLTPIIFKGICDKQMHICIPSHVKSIDLGIMNLFQLTDFLHEL
jgi:hypothetical protein